MALEPITRQEQIIAGKDLEPITRMEKFLKKYGVSNYFGETTVKGDTLTWDGNTDGKLIVDECFVKVSDAIVLIDDLKNGYSVYLNVNGETSCDTFSVDSVIDLGGMLIAVEDYVFCTAIDNFTADGIVFPEKGIYFYLGAFQVGEGILGEGTFSLTIPNYNGFETTVIKPIETKYLPEHLHFGTETKVVEGDTLTWDGNTEGHVTFADSYVHVSDAVPTMDDFANGFLWRNADSEDEIAAYSLSNHGGMLMCDYVLVVPYDNFAFEGAPMTFEKKGIYLVIQFGEQCITIPGYGKFVSEQTVVKPLDEKYLPILTSPSGKKFKLSVDDSGAVTATEV
jgi:hypothetical protein